MYTLEYHKKYREILLSAWEKYADFFDHSISDESIEARYGLYEYMFDHYGIIPALEKNQDGIPENIEFTFEWRSMSLYWSLSHTENYVGSILSDLPTGIDLAEYRERDDALLWIHDDREYTLLWGKNWENFYLLWTAKESIIKLDHLVLDDASTIILDSIISSGYIFCFSWKKYIIHTKREQDLFISYAFFYEPI
jgi:hypothetical protein